MVCSVKSWLVVCLKVAHLVLAESLFVCFSFLRLKISTFYELAFVCRRKSTGGGGFLHLLLVCIEYGLREKSGRVLIILSRVNSAEKAEMWT